MMGRSSAGRYDGAPLMCRTIAGAGGPRAPSRMSILTGVRELGLAVLETAARRRPDPSDRS